MRRQYAQAALFVTDMSGTDYRFALTVRESSTFAVQEEKSDVKVEAAGIENALGESAAASNGNRLSIVKRKAAV